MSKESQQGKVLQRVALEGLAAFPELDGDLAGDTGYLIEDSFVDWLVDHMSQLQIQDEELVAVATSDAYLDDPKLLQFAKMGDFLLQAVLGSPICKADVLEAIVKECPGILKDNWSYRKRLFENPNTSKKLLLECVELTIKEEDESLLLEFAERPELPPQVRRRMIRYAEESDNDDLLEMLEAD